jgi:hypothetical protein
LSGQLANNGNFKLIIFSHKIFTLKKNFYWIVILSGILGAIFSYAYIHASPKYYELVVRIDMLPNASGTPVETPNSLVARITPPNFIVEHASAACGYDSKIDNLKDLSKKIKISIPKGASSQVELTIRMTSPTLAEKCASSLVKTINNSQSLMLESERQQMILRLALVNRRLSEFRSLITKSKSSNDQGFLTLNKIHQLEDEVTNLIAGIEYVPALPSKVTFGAEPVGPKPLVFALVGFFSGIFIGLMFCIIRSTVLIFLKHEKKGSDF